MSQRPARTKVTILVHPGSACGSADFNLGKYEARAGREGLVHDMEATDGDVFVIDGSLSVELPEHPGLDGAIAKALADAAARGDRQARIMGSDDEEFNQCDAARELISRYSLLPERHSIVLTGAWYDPDDEEGCVNSVYDVFSEAGFSVDVSDNALSIDGDAIAMSP